jgi:hypothetical protein
MLALTAIISMPSMIILLAFKPWDSITVFFATLDFVSDLVVGTIYAARSHNMVLEAPDRRFFLLMAVLVFFFTGLQMLLSMSGFVIRLKLISEKLSMCFIPVHLGLCAWSVVLFSQSRKAEGSEQVLRLNFHGHFFDLVIPIAAPLAILLLLQTELFFKLVPFFWEKSCGYIRDTGRARTRKIILQLIAFATCWMVLPFQISAALSVAFGKANAEDTLEVGSLAADLIGKPKDTRSNQLRCHRIGYLFQCVEAVPVTAVQILVLWHARKTCLPVTWIELVSIVSSGLNLFVLFFLRAIHGLTYGSLCARMCGCSS